MKKYILFLLLLSATLVHAQSKDESEVAAAVDRLNKALVAADSNTLANLTAAALSYGHSSGKVEDRQTFIQNATSGPFKFVSIEATDQTIHLVNDDAIVRHIFTAKATTNGAPTDLKLTVLQVWQKQHGKWKLLARQAAKL